MFGYVWSIKNSKYRNTIVNVFICFINDFNTVSYSSYMNDIVQCEITFISAYYMYVLMYNDETIIKNKYKYIYMYICLSKLTIN